MASTHPEQPQPGPSSASTEPKPPPEFPSHNIKEAYAKGTWVPPYQQRYEYDPHNPHNRDAAPTKASLKAWWKQFTFAQRAKPKHEEAKAKEAQAQATHVFGVPLRESLECASVQISTADKDRGMYVWGVIPVVVAKCGLYLKENATEIEGIFRINGSNKRMRDLQDIFEAAPKYGKSLDWGVQHYTPHDVASVFRRYLTQMPDPVIPPEMYSPFRDVLAHRPVDSDKATAAFKRLIRTMPDVNQYLLLYVLDLLSVFARKSDKNLMDEKNLSVIFRPGILRHPAHELTPAEHQLSQEVIEFLIAHQDWFMIDVPKLQAPPRGSALPLPSTSKTPAASGPGASSSSSMAPVPPSAPALGGGPDVRMSGESDYMVIVPSTEEEGGWTATQVGATIGRRRTTSAAPSPTTSSALAAAGAATGVGTSASGPGQAATEMGELAPVPEAGSEVLGEGAATVSRSRTLPSERRARISGSPIASTADVLAPSTSAAAPASPSAAASVASDSGAASREVEKRKRLNVLRKSKRRSTVGKAEESS